jgi:hypothetical protein
VNRFRGTVVGVIGLILGGVAAAAAPVKVTPLVADGRVFASFTAPGAYTDDVRDAVKSGLPVTFTFVVELRRPSTLWFDRTLATATVASAVKFDNLSRMYQVSKSSEGRVAWSDRTDKEDQMRAWLTAFDRVPLNAAGGLEANADYYLSVHLQATPRGKFSWLWPWHDEGSGRADFTFIR